MRRLSLYTIILVGITRLFISCATPGAPTGGPIDKTPPKIVGYEPENLTTNFSSKTIRIEFDEWIEVQDVRRQVIISPPLDPAPEITARKSVLIVKFESPLADSTTYSIFFGDAIKDLREGNQAENILYVFSTGPVLDSMEISGKVKTLEGQKLPENTFVQLYTEEEDSIVVKERPLYAFKLKESDPSFKIQYLPHKSFKLVVLSDNNRNFLYDLPTEWIGAYPEMITLDTSVTDLEVLLTLPEEDKYKITEYNAALQNGMLNLTLNKAYNPQMDTISVKILNPGTVTQKPRYNTTDRASFYIRTDSSSIRCEVSMSGVVIDTIKLRRDSKGAQPGFISTIPQAAGKNNNLAPNKNQPILFKSSIPFKTVDATLISIQDTREQNLSFEIEVLDSIWGFELRADFEEGQEYLLKFADSVIQFANDRFSSTITYPVNVAPPLDYGGLSLDIRLPSLDTMYVVSVKTGQGKIIHEQIVLGDTAITFKSATLAAGDYLVEVLEDLNRSGTWNSGSYWRRTGPERVFRSETVSLKENWEQELVIVADFSNPVMPMAAPEEKAPAPAAAADRTPAGGGRDAGRPMFDR